MREVTMKQEKREGWYTDPYTRHEARWMSDDKPTKLVRDGLIESYDNPPPLQPTSIPIQIEVEPTHSHGEDLLRADAAEGNEPYDAKRVQMAIFDELGEMGPQPF